MTQGMDSGVTKLEQSQDTRLKPNSKELNYINCQDGHAIPHELFFDLVKFLILISCRLV